MTTADSLATTAAERAALVALRKATRESGGPMLRHAARERPLTLPQIFIRRG